MTAWTDQRDEWVRSVSAKHLLLVIAKVAKAYSLDENLGDTRERAETLLWLATRGKAGREWGSGGAAAEDLGFWQPPKPRTYLDLEVLPGMVRVRPSGTRAAFVMTPDQAHEEGTGLIRAAERARPGHKEDE